MKFFEHVGLKGRPQVMLVLLVVFASCTHERQETPHDTNLEGTWQLISGMTISKGDTTMTEYNKTIAMIKVVNGDHFAFLNHDLNNGKDSTASFVAGGGRYELTGNQYTEHLEYCSDRSWEGNDFVFGIKIKNDTLIQRGIEKIEGTSVDRINIETYVRLRR